MFSKLDTSNDLFLDQSELAAINLEKYEVCIRPFFNSCDSYRDGKVSTAEWCLCFWRESEFGMCFSWEIISKIMFQCKKINKNKRERKKSILKNVFKKYIYIYGSSEP